MSNLPCGIWLLEKIGLKLPYNSTSRNTCFRWVIFALTYVTYTAFHASRKPITVVKNVWNQNCTSQIPPPGTNTSNPHWCDWQPFAGDDSNTVLGFVDSAFLFSYAFFMFFSGYLAERMDLRYFLALGLMMSAVFTWAMGAAYVWNIHTLGYFIAMQAISGMFQATGWPGVVTVMGNWNPKSKRGLIFGIWNSHTCLGNILGSLMASAYVDTDWGMSFIVPSMFAAGVALLNFLFLTPLPLEAGCTPPPPESPPLLTGESESSSTRVLTNPALVDTDSSTDSGDLSDGLTPGTGAGPIVAPSGGGDKAISFIQALLLPGVIPFAICLFFSKLVCYTFLYWLPRYLHSAAGYSPSESANLSTLFDMGGILGGILAGLANDWTGVPGIVCVILLVIAIPMMFVYQSVATVSHGLNTALLVVVGLLVNGPYSLITTAVSADLGTSPSLRGNSRALATVTAIIDGTGSVGAAIGPILAGYASAGDDWRNVFIILMVSDAIAILCLTWVVKHELTALLERRRRRLAAAAVDGGC